MNRNRPEAAVDLRAANFPRLGHSDDPAAPAARNHRPFTVRLTGFVSLGLSGRVYRPRGTAAIPRTERLCDQLARIAVSAQGHCVSCMVGGFLFRLSLCCLRQRHLWVLARRRVRQLTPVIFCD